MKYKTAGRPKQSYKYLNPITNEPISAIEYHRMIKILNKGNSNVKNKEERFKNLIKLCQDVNNLIIEELKKA